VTLDPTSAAVMATIAVVVCGMTFIATSLSPRYASSGARLWGLSYLLVMVAVCSNLVAVAVPAGTLGAAWGVALANAAGVAAVGCLLLGFRAYNGAQVQGPALMITALAFLTVAAAIVGSMEAVGPGGLAVAYAALAIVSVGAALHAVVGRTRRHAMAWIFAGALILEALFALARAVIYAMRGFDDELGLTWFAAIPESLTLVSVGLVATIATFVLRSELARDPAASYAATGAEGVIGTATFLSELSAVLRRASTRTELVVVIAVLVEDVGAITASFGREVADATTRVLRSAVREYASPIALVGESDDRTIVLVTTTASSPADARRQAGLLYRGVVQRFVGARGIVVPGVGVGVALSQTLGYDPQTLVEGATIAAVLASESDETSVVFASSRSLPRTPFPPVEG
jgi:hypothetical protein